MVMDDPKQVILLVHNWKHAEVVFGKQLRQVVPHVILLGAVSGHRAAYAEVCDGVTPQDLQRDALDYRRAKDKSEQKLRVLSDSSAISALNNL